MPCTPPEFTARKQGYGARQNRRKSCPIAFRYGQGRLRRPSTDKLDYQANKGAYVLKRSRKCGPYRHLAILASSQLFHTQRDAFSTSLSETRAALNSRNCLVGILRALDIPDSWLLGPIYEYRTPDQERDRGL